jgi:hypothetical protein
MVLVLAGCAAVAPAPTGDVDSKIEVAQEMPGVSKGQIFDASKAWIGANFRSGKRIIEYENREEGTLIANSTVPFPCSGSECTGKGDWVVLFTMRVDIKDGGSRVSFPSVLLTWPQLSYRPGYEGPVRPYGNWDAVKARLLRLAAELQRSSVQRQ